MATTASSLDSVASFAPDANAPSRLQKKQTSRKPREQLRRCASSSSTLLDGAINHGFNNTLILKSTTPTTTGKKLMRSLLFFSLILALLLIGLKVGLALMGNEALLGSTQLNQAQGAIDSISSSAWEFGRPLLQLIVVLALGEWFVSRLGLKISSIGLGAINIQTFIAVAIVFTFCLAALGDLPGLPYMKDIVLIVIGFYFGTRSRQQSNQDTAVRTDEGEKSH